MKHHGVFPYLHFLFCAFVSFGFSPGNSFSRSGLPVKTQARNEKSWLRVRSQVPFTGPRRHRPAGVCIPGTRRAVTAADRKGLTPVPAAVFRLAGLPGEASAAVPDGSAAGLFHAGGSEEATSGGSTDRPGGPLPESFSINPSGNGWIPLMGNTAGYSLCSGDSLITDSLFLKSVISSANGPANTMPYGLSQKCSGCDPDSPASPLYGILQLVNSLEKSGLPGSLSFQGPVVSPGLYRHRGDLVLEDTLIFGGDSSSLFCILVEGNLTLSEDFCSRMRGTSFVNVLWAVTGEILINNHSINRPGIFFARGGIRVGENSRLASFLYSPEKIILMPVEGPFRYSTPDFAGYGDEVVLGYHSDPCTPATGFSGNLVCNPGFQTLLNGGLGGPNAFRSHSASPDIVSRWVPLIDNNTPDLFNAAISSPELGYDVPVNTYSPVFPGLGCPGGSSGITFSAEMPPVAGNDKDCIYAGISTRGRYDENMGREFVAQTLRSPVFSDRRYLVGAWVASSMAAAYYPATLDFEFSTASQVKARRLNVETGGLAHAGNWIRASAVLDPQPNNPGPPVSYTLMKFGKLPPSLLVPGLPASPQDATELVDGTVPSGTEGMDRIGYTLIDNFFVVEFPRLIPSIQSVCYKPVNPFATAMEDVQFFAGVSGATLSWTGPGGFSYNSVGNLYPVLSGTYSLTVEIGGVVYPIGSVEINLTGGNFTFDISAPPSVCQGDEVTLSPEMGLPPNATFAWHGPALFSSAAFSAVIPSIGQSQTGLYTLYINGTCNGLAINGIGTVSIVVKPLEAITDIVPGQVACSGYPTTFMAVGPVSGVYNWSVNNEVQVLNSPVNLYTHLFFQPGEYDFRVLKIQPNGCQSEIFKTIQVLGQNFSLNLQASPVVPVIGDPTTFHVQTSLQAPPAQIKWFINGNHYALYNNQASPSIIWDACPPAQVKVEVTSAQGCVKEAGITIPEVATAFQIEGPLTMCYFSTVSYTTTNSTPGAIWEWFWNGVQIPGFSGPSCQFTPSSFPHVADVNYLTVRRTTGTCVRTETLSIRVMNYSTMELVTGALHVCPGQPVTFSALGTTYGVGSYQWMVNGHTIEGQNGPTLVYTFPHPGTVPVSVRFVSGDPMICDSETAVYTVEVSGAAIQLTTASGACQTQGNPDFQLSAAPVADASFCWRIAGTTDCIGGNTHSVTLPFSGFLPAQPPYYRKVVYEVDVVAAGCTTHATGEIELYRNPFTGEDGTRSRPHVGITYLRKGSESGFAFAWLASSDPEPEMPLALCSGTRIMLQAGSIETAFTPGVNTPSYFWRRVLPSGGWGEEQPDPLVIDNLAGDEVVWEVFARITGGCESAGRRIAIRKEAAPAAIVEPVCSEDGSVFVSVTFPKGVTPLPYREIVSPSGNYSDQVFFPGTGGLRLRIYDSQSDLSNGMEYGTYTAFFQFSETCLVQDEFTVLGLPVYSGETKVYDGGTVFVTRPLRFENCSLSFQNGTRVYFVGQAQPGLMPIGGTVYRAGAIELDNSVLTLESGVQLDATCDKMWQGISVGNGSELRVNAATISNAFQAIEVVPGAAYLKVENSFFRNNYVGIRNRKPGHFSVQGCNFSSDFRSMYRPFNRGGNQSTDPEAFAWSFAHLQLGPGACPADGESVSGNTFRNCLYGILAEPGATVKVRGNTFENACLAAIRLGIQSEGQPHSITGGSQNHIQVPDLAALPGKQGHTPYAYRQEWQSVSAALGLPASEKTSFGILGFDDQPITGTQISFGTLLGSGPAPSGGFRNQVGMYLQNTFQTRILDNTLIRGFREGIILEGPLSAQTYTDVSRNKLEDNGTGILLKGGNYRLDFRCNYFQTGPIPAGYPRTGLKIGPMVAFENNAIGGQVGINDPLPNANIWPRKTGSVPAASPDYWTSVQKSGEGGQLNYYAFKNEFLGRISPDVATSQTNFILPRAFKIAKSPKAVRDWCNLTFAGSPDQISACIADPMASAGWHSEWVPVCSNLDDETDYFPERQATGTGTTDLPPRTEPAMATLGNPVPNPASETVVISLFLPVARGRLVVFEPASGREVWQTEISRGHQRVKVPVHRLAAGVYGYRLEAACPCPEPRMLLVLR